MKTDTEWGEERDEGNKNNSDFFPDNTAGI